MIVTTLQQVVDSVPERYKMQYCRYGKWGGLSPEFGPPEDTYNRLMALPSPLSKQDVDEIIQNTSWTRLQCDECQREVETIVRLGEEPDYESSTARICPDCLRQAISLIYPGSTLYFTDAEPGRTESEGGR